MRMSEEVVVTPEVVAGAAAPVETPAPAPVAQPVDKAQVDRVASKFAALTRKDRELAQKEKEIADKLAALESREKEMGGKFAPFEEVSELLSKGEHYAAAKKLNLDLMKLAEGVADDKPLPEWDPHIKGLASKVEEISKKLAEAEEAKRRMEEESYNQKVNQFTEHITSYISRDFPIVAAQRDGIQTVIALMEETYRQTGKALSNQEACQMVNEYYIEEFKKVMNIPQFKQILGLSQADSSNPPAQPAPAESISVSGSKVESSKQDAKKPAASNRPPALGNKGAAHSVPAKDFKDMSDDEKKDHLAAKLRARRQGK
jgi:hypothetical protein